LMFSPVVALYKENMSLWCAVCLDLLRARNTCVGRSIPSVFF
jgi:hypothetical protein